MMTIKKYLENVDKFLKYCNIDFLNISDDEYKNFMKKYNFFWTNFELIQPLQAMKCTDCLPFGTISDSKEYLNYIKGFK